MLLTIYRRDHNGKIRTIGEFTPDQLFSSFGYFFSGLDAFGNDLNDRVRSDQLPIDPFPVNRNPDFFRNWMHAYVAYDQRGHLVTVDQLRVLKCEFHNRLYREWMKHKQPRVYNSWSKCRPYRRYRRPKTTQERRWYHAWDDEEVIPYRRARRSPSNLRDAWSDVRRSDAEDRSWKRHRKTQWKEKKNK